MADNVAITQGSGTTIWTDEVTGSKHVQYIKLVDGTTDSVEVISGSTNRGLKADVYKITRIAFTPTIDTSAYAAGDAVGGLLTFSNAARFSGGGVRLKKVLLVDKDQEMAPYDLVLFKVTFTATADQAAFDPSDADLANIAAVVRIEPGSYANFTDNAVGASRDLDIPILLDGTSLFGQLVTRGTPTYSASSDLTVILSILQE
jgi:hypothetical protein